MLVSKARLDSSLLAIKNDPGGVQKETGLHLKLLPFLSAHVLSFFAGLSTLEVSIPTMSNRITHTSVI